MTVELAAAFPRHGSGQHGTPVALPGRPVRPDAPAPLPSEADPVAPRDREPSRGDERRTELRLRPLRAFDSARGGRRPGPALLDRGLLLGRAGPARDARPIRRGVRGRPDSVARRSIPATGSPRRPCSSRAVDRRASPIGTLLRLRSHSEQGNLVEVHDDDPRARRLVGCGTPGPGTRVVIVDPLTLQAVSAESRRRDLGGRAGRRPRILGATRRLGRDFRRADREARGHSSGPATWGS